MCVCLIEFCIVKNPWGKFIENMALSSYCIVTNIRTWIVVSAMTTSCIKPDGEMALFFFLKASLTLRNILFQRCKKKIVCIPLVPFPRSGCKVLLGK